jgi:hypothetical protein
LAREAERSAANIDELVGKLRRFVTADARPEEIGKLEAFEAAWAEVADVDMRLLALAVANTNLKAVRLSAGDGAAALDRFVDALTEMQNATSDLEVVRQLSAGAISALRVQSVLLVHIPSADDAEMTDVERRMNEWSESVERILGSLRDKGQPSPEMLGRASLAWGEYRKITAEVLRLSRQNTNVISFDVSVHEKRRVTQACLSALSELLTAVGSVPRATR